MFLLHMILHLLLHSSIATGVVVTPTYQLVDSLLKRPYDVDTRPVADEDDVLEIKIIPNLFILLAMDQQQETITFSNEFMMSWLDPQLSWDGAEFNYTKEWVKMPEDKVWTPDVIFDKSISISERLSKSERMIDLKSDGTLRMSDPSVIEFPCSLNTAAFPYDVQICNLSMSSWNFEISKIVVTSTIYNITPIPDQFDGNSEWDLLSITAVDSEYSSFNTNYSQVIYQVTLKRRPVYYVLVIQAPTFIIATLAIFGLFTPFNQIGERREKATLGLNMFVAISMMLTLVSDMMPKASKLPLLGNYILAEIFVCAIGCLISMMNLMMHHRCYTRVIRPPEWVHRYILFDFSRRKVDAIERDDSTVCMKEAPGDASVFEGIKDSLLRALHTIRKEIEVLQKRNAYRKIWYCVFDRVDLLCVVVFQVLNITVSALFMR